MRRFIQTLFKIPEDPAFRYGLKFGLAGVAAVFLALLIRLQEPTWALFTVFVLMIAQYVGAIGEKSVFRFLGTLVGGIIGYLLTGSLQQEPLIFLLVIGIVVGGSTAMFGQSRYPYAFLLCGLTTVVVSSNGLADPANSWQYMVWRIEEVGLGIIVTLVVQSVIWPRFARIEFLSNMRRAFGDLRECFVAASDARSREEAEAASAKAEEFPERITALRRLLDFGARESQHFRDRLATYFEITGCQARLASAISTLREPLPETSIYRIRLSAEIADFSRFILDALEDLQNPGSSPGSRKARRDAMSAVVARIESALFALRRGHASQQIPAEEAMLFSVRILAFEEIRNHICRAQELLDSLPGDPFQPSKEHDPFLSPYPPPFWVRVGIKSGIAVVLALLVQDWLNPPGATLFVLGTWVFTALNATSPGGQGDRRAFHFMVFSILALLGLSLLLLAGRPLLSSYAVMNTVLFTWLFVWGYLSYSSPGVSIPMQLGMLSIVGILSLNGQEPIGFQQIVDFFFGMALALVLSSVIQRVLWPSLPQWEIRDRMIEMVNISRRILRDGPAALPLWQRTRLALIPGEVATRLPYICPPVYPEGEDARLRELLSRLFKIGHHLSVTVRRLDPVFVGGNMNGSQEAVRAVERGIDRALASILDALRSNRPAPFDHPAFESVLEDFKSKISEQRSRMISEAVAPLKVLELLGFAERYRLAAKDVKLALECLKSLNIPLINSDCSL